MNAFEIQSSDEIIETNKIQIQSEGTPFIVHTQSQMSVAIMPAGNMGDYTVNALNRHGIGVLRGCAEIKKTTELWLADSLHDSGIDCREHQHGCHKA